MKNIFDKISLEVKVGLLIVAAFLLFFGFVAIISESTTEPQNSSGRMCVQYCDQNGMKVREWRPGRCSCTNVGTIEEER